MNLEPATEFSSYTPDELIELYEKKPDYFNELAAEAIRPACIGVTPELTVRLRQMQWSIDGKLRKAKSPLERLQIMENIFYGYVFGDDGELSHLKESCSELRRAIGGDAKLPDKKPALYLVKN